MSLVLGLTPGELLALRWDDIDRYALALDEATVDGLVCPTLPTKQSRGFVALPASLRAGFGGAADNADLEIYIQEIPDTVRQAVQKLDAVLASPPAERKEERKD
jgi:integrase